MKYNVSKLQNNITVLTCNMPGLRSVSINILVKVGSRYENDNQQGISHFLEHMAFKGTANRTAKQIAEEFDDIGGNFNAYTSREQTVFQAKVTDEYTNSALEILADILQNSIFAPEDIEKEYNVISQEIAQVFDTPDDLVFEKLTDTAFSGQALGRSILGTYESIKNYNTQSFRDFVREYYVGNNMFISLAGAVEHEEVVNLIEKLFKDVPSGTTPKFTLSNFTPGEVAIIKDNEQSNIVIGFKSTSYKDIKRHYATQMLAMILGGGFSSRLFQEIREKHGLAYTVSTFVNSYEDIGLFGIYAALHPSKVNQYFDILIPELKKACLEIKPQEISRACAQARSGLIMAQERSGFKSEEMARYYANFGRFISLDEILDSINKITQEDILEVANSMLKTAPVISNVGPVEINITSATFLEKIL